MATPLIEAGDCTVSGSNTASGSWAVAHPAAAVGDLLIFNVAWDNSSSVPTVTPPAGPNGETLTSIEGPVASGGTEIRCQSWYTVATATWASGTRTFTPSASESWSATVIKVLAGEFDEFTPIGNNASSASAGTAETSVSSPAFSAGSTDTDGRLVWFSAVDTDPLGATNPTGWTILQRQDLGAVAHGIATRDAAVTSAESISSGSWAIAGDSWASIAYVVREPLAVRGFPSSVFLAPFGLGKSPTGAGNVGQALETDTAYALLGRLSAGRSNEADGAYALAALGLRVVGLSTETNTARALSPLSAVTAAVEVDTAYARAGVAIKAVGLATETDTAYNRAPGGDTGLATETDTAYPLGSALTVKTAVEVDTAYARAATQPGAVGTATETDTAYARTGLMSAGRASETDTAFALASSAATARGFRSRVLLTPFGLGKDSRTFVGTATETDTAYALEAANPVHVRVYPPPLPVAWYADSGYYAIYRQFGLGVPPSNRPDIGDTLVTPAFETNTAYALAASSIAAVGLATETNTAYALAFSAAATAGLATETDTAYALAAVQIRPVGLSTETDVAERLLAESNDTVGPAFESDTAYALSSYQTTPALQASEADTAYALTAVSKLLALAAYETDTAYPLVGISVDVDNRVIVSARSYIATPVLLDSFITSQLGYISYIYTQVDLESGLDLEAVT